MAIDERELRSFQLLPRTKQIVIFHVRCGGIGRTCGVKSYISAISIGHVAFSHVLTDSAIPRIRSRPVQATTNVGSDPSDLLCWTRQRSPLNRSQGGGAQ